MAKRSYLSRHQVCFLVFCEHHLVLADQAHEIGLLFLFAFVLVTKTFRERARRNDVSTGLVRPINQMDASFLSLTFRPCVQIL